MTPFKTLAATGVALAALAFSSDGGMLTVLYKEGALRRYSVADRKLQAERALQSLWGTPREAEEAAAELYRYHEARPGERTDTEAEGAAAALRATRVRRWGRSSSNRDWYSRRWSKLHWKSSSSNARPKPSSSNRCASMPTNSII